MTQMTPEQLEAIRERAEDTTFEKAYVKGDPWKGYEVRNEGNGMVIAEVSCGTDAEFIANAREDIPALLAEVERLQKELTAYKEFGSLFIGDARNGFTFTELVERKIDGGVAE